MLLRSLGLPSDQIPVEEPEASARYRTLLADRRVLVVLDNARSVTQVRPLLPGSPGCLALVTSRDRLAGLVARDGAHRLTLDVLDADDAHDLLAHLLGVAGVRAEPEATAELARACGYLPLALRIAAANLTDHPDRSVGAYVEDLIEGHRLAALHVDDDVETAVRTAFDLSYQALPEPAQRLFRLLGLVPGPDFTPAAAAALADVPEDEARRLLDRLASAHMVEEHARDRYTFHDLLRAYARDCHAHLDRQGESHPVESLLDQLHEAHLLQEPVPGRYQFHDLGRTHATHTATAEDADQEKRAALTRLFDHYQHAATVAMDTTHPYEHEGRPCVRSANTTTPDLSSDPTQATGWLDAELPNLLTAAAYAADNGWPEHTWHLSTTLHRHLRTRGRLHDAETLHRQALTTARAIGSRIGELDALIYLGNVYQTQSRYERATDCHTRALEIARITRNRARELDALRGLGHDCLLQGNYTEATCHFRHVLEVARNIGHHTGELDALRGLGYLHRAEGQYEQAADHYWRALEIAHTIGHRGVELDMLLGLGVVHKMQGGFEPAANYYRQALEIAGTIGHRAGELAALNNLGNILRLQREYQQSLDQYTRVIVTARTIGYRTSELRALTGIGHVHRLQGRYAQAGYHYQQALDLARESGDLNQQFEALNGLGRLRHATDHSEAAVAYHHQALKLAVDLGHPDDRARAHDGLALAHRALNQHSQAREHWQHALNILTSLGTDHTDKEETNAAAVRGYLAELDQHLEPHPRWTV